MRRWGLAITVTLCSSLGFAQGDDIYCRLDDKGVVLCVKGGSTIPIFTHVITLPDLTLLVFTSVPNPQEREKCRLRTERFREQDLEEKFHPSIDGLRLKAEEIRRESEGNLALYRQVILIYHGLRDRYRNAVQGYKEANRSCNPYATRPTRT